MVGENRVETNRDTSPDGVNAWRLLQESQVQALNIIMFIIITIIRLGVKVKSSNPGWERSYYVKTTEWTPHEEV
jgi:hypothetical protein